MISRGRGYVAAEGNKGPGTSIGVIPVDSNFSPVRRVRYEVSSARVGQRTDYDKLTLEIETDGSVDPRGALCGAAGTLIGRLAIFADPEQREDGRRAGRGDEPPPGAACTTSSSRSWSSACARTTASSASGVETIGDLISKTEAELSAIPNFGKKSIEEVKENLAAHGLDLREE